MSEADNKWYCFHEHFHKHHYSIIISLFEEILSEWSGKDREYGEDDFENEPRAFEHDDFNFTDGWEDAEGEFSYSEEPEPPLQDEFKFAKDWSEFKWKVFLEYAFMFHLDRIRDNVALVGCKWEGPSNCGVCRFGGTDCDPRDPTLERPAKKQKCVKTCGVCGTEDLDYEGSCDCKKYSALCEDCGIWGHDGLWYCGGDACNPPNQEPSASDIIK